MATESNVSGPPDGQEVTLIHHGTPHTFSFLVGSTIEDLSDEVAISLSVPASNQKFMVSKLGTLKPPFKDPDLPISSIADKKITLIGSTASEANVIPEAAHKATGILRPRPVQKVKAYRRHDWKKEQDEIQHTFTTLKPLQYLPNPHRSLQFLERLRDDPGIKAAMRKHKFTVPLLTEMNPDEHTQSNHEGTSRTLGLNRNAGEVIELRLRTDAHDGYRDYKTIRKTLCHELAHNVWGPHDKNFWALCRQIEKEVDAADWKSGGHSVGNEDFYEGGTDEGLVDDHGGWTGGEFVLGASGKIGPGLNVGMSRREILARAAEERAKKLQEQDKKNESAGSGS